MPYNTIQPAFTADAEVQSVYAVNLLQIFLKQRNLLIRKSRYSSSEFIVKTQSPLNSAPEHLLDLHGRTYSELLSYNIEYASIFNKEPPATWDLEQRLTSATLEFFFLLMSAYKNSVLPEQFIQLLDKKISWNRPQQIRDMQAVLRYLIAYAPELLLEYVTRPFFLQAHYEETLALIMPALTVERDKIVVFEALSNIWREHNRHAIGQEGSHLEKIQILAQKYLRHTRNYPQALVPALPIQNNKNFLASTEQAIVINIDYTAVEQMPLVKNYSFLDYGSTLQALTPEGPSPRSFVESTLALVAKELQKHHKKLGFKQVAVIVGQEAGQSTFLQPRFIFEGLAEKSNTASSSFNAALLQEVLQYCMEKVFSYASYSAAQSAHLSEKEVLHFILRNTLEKKK